MDSKIVVLVLICVALIWLPWIWRYKFRPHLAKSNLHKILLDHPEGKRLGRIVSMLHTLYRGIHSDRLSQKERARLGLKDDAYIYSEIDFMSFLLLLDKIKPQSGQVFYDLGSGAGKAVFTAGLAYDLSKACGIEILPGLVKLATTQINKAKTLVNLGDKNLTEVYLQRISSVQFINDNFLNCDISDGDLIFINATCLNYPTWEALIEKLKKLKVGSHIITTTKKIQDADFEVVYQAKELMSWGMNSVNIYKKIN
jgi:SAM-dependent methyltransferase